MQTMSQPPPFERPLEDSNSSSVPSVSPTDTSTEACPHCGLDWRSTNRLVASARRKIELQEEKLAVERKLLKQDQRNFKRRLRAANGGLAERQKEVEQQLGELQAQHAVIVRSLHNEIARLEKEGVSGEKIEELQKQLEEKQTVIDGYEKRQEVSSEGSSECDKCRELQWKVKNHEQNMQSTEKEYKANLESAQKQLASLQVQSSQSQQSMQRELQQLRAQNAELTQQLRQQATNYEAPTKPEYPIVTEREWKGEAHSGLYSGQWHQEKPHGSGTLRRDDGAVYNGEWHAGHFAGQGVLAKLEGDLLDGTWVASKLEGHCTTCWSDGRIYQGPYVGGNRHGNDAIMTWPHGAHYRGEFVDDKRTGQGKYVYSDGRSYEGAYRDDRPHGYGVLKSSDGSVVYDGHWENGEFLRDREDDDSE